MCDMCCCCFDEEKLESIENKIDSLIDDVKDLKEDMRSINKGKHKPLKKFIEKYMDSILDYRLRDIERDVRDLSDDMSSVNKRVSDCEAQKREDIYKPMTIEDLHINAKIDGMEDFLIYVCVDGVNIPMRLCEWDVENHCVILHEKFNSNANKHCTECKHCIGEPTMLVSEEGKWAMAYSCFHGNPKKKGMFTCREKACEFFEGRDSI